MTEVNLSVMSVRDWPIEPYLVHLAAGGARPGTVQLRRYQLERAARAVGRPMAEVTTADLEAVLARSSWGDATRRSMRSALRGIMAWAAADGRLTDDPAARLPRVRAGVGRPRPAAEEAVQAALATLDRRQVLMVRLAAYAGLRAGEIALVHRRDLHRVPEGWSLDVHGKGGRVRRVPLDSGTAAMIQGQGEWCFPGRIGGHLSAHYVSRLLSRALPPGVTGHMLRHRFASVAYARGGRDLLAVRELLGHASVATTQVYTAVPDDAARAAVLAAAA